VFVADELAAWLLDLLAEAGREKITSLALGSEQERALRSAATAAVQRTAEELRSDDEERAAQLGLVVSQVFGEPVPGRLSKGQATVLEALQAGITAQLAVLDDASLTGTGYSSADVLGIPGTVVAQNLIKHLLWEIVVRGSRGGPLFPLASQLNHDMARLDSEHLKAMVDDVLQVLARIEVACPVATAPSALAQLPSPVAGFTGRHYELALLAGLLDPGNTVGSVVVSAVVGLAGVGKTTLAVQAGHAAAQRGWFGGGVLFIDLHGYEEAPVEPGQALDALLRSLGVPAEHIPPTAEERAALYRSILARITQPVLVIADNASSESQVRLLQPGAGPHKVLVTSRHTLAGLNARLVDVKVLDDATGLELLDAVLKVASPDDDRISGDPQGAAKVAGLCGGLPLALQITAALLKADPALTVAELSNELAVESRRLERLVYDDGSSPAELSVAAAFELSYRRLDETAARMFRLMPVSPGPDIPAATAAVLADLPISTVHSVLGGLTRAHLVEIAPGRGRRWRMHDLLRLYATRLSEQHTNTDSRERARNRLLGYYVKMAGTADYHLRALAGAGVPQVFSGVFNGREDAVAWLDAERANLVAAVNMAASTGRDQVAKFLPLLLAEYFGWRRHFEDQLTTIAISVSIAHRLGDRPREGDALTNLGLALRELDRPHEALIAHELAAGIFRKIGDRHREAMALTNLGLALPDVGQFDEAITACQSAARIYRELRDRHREAMALNNLGLALQGQRRVNEAIVAHQRAADIYGKVGDRHRLGTALINLGLALQGVCRFDDAIIACQQAGAAFRDTGDRHGEGMALNNLGVSLFKVQRFDEAAAAQESAAVIFRETGDKRRERVALDDLEAVRNVQ
jgi:tetratricopeptide (TPR) repeat protein